MKKFIIQTSLYLLLFAAALHGVAYYMLFTKSYQTHVLGNEIYYALAKSKKKSKSKKLVMGDSVAQQLFDNKATGDTLNSIACNQSISLAGQFVLLNNYLMAGNRPDSVFFISTPFSFQNNLDQIFTFQYFLKPFYTDEYKPYFSDLVKDKIKLIPHNNLAQYPLIATTNWAPEFEEKEDTTYNFLSPISVEYLIRIKALAAQYRFKLILLPTPTPVSRRKEVDILNKKEYIKTGLEAEFSDFFKRVQFIDDKYFIDRIHLKDPAAYARYFADKYF